MTGLSVRRVASACAVSAASALAILLPGATPASASCAGAGIKGQGSTLQEVAQHEVWIPGYNGKCGETKIEEYKGTGSGAGLASWGVGGGAAVFGRANAYVGTDQPPNPTQKGEIEGHGVGKVLSIPTLQAAVSVDMHLPAGCTAAESSNKASKGRLVLTLKTLEAIFSRKVTKWSEIKDGGDKLLPSGCEGTSEIIRVVRKEGSGTTAITKKFLFEINDKPVDGTKTWDDLAEQNKNLEWPEEGVDLERAEGGKGVAKKVAELAGSVGYANLADARAVAAFTPAGGGGEGKPTFWADLQHNYPTEPATYTDPSTNKESNTKAQSNCTSEKYVTDNSEGKIGKFPPPSTESAWNDVTAALKEGKYALCGFTYDLSLTHFGGAAPETTTEEVETVSAYFKYILNEGQPALTGSDYLGLPEAKTESKNVLAIARKGPERIAF
jgi:ABC-type phosphate transport system substrate-binding protein